MDTKTLLEEILQSGQQLAGQAREMAERKLDIPESGEQREAMLSGMKKGALAAGALALLLGTRGGRRLGGAALKLGSLAAVGGLAYKAWQNWQQQQGADPASVASVDRLSGDEAERRSLILLRAMIAAAKADGHIDEAEMARIRNEMQKLGLGESAATFLGEEIQKPLDVQDVVAGVTDPEMAAEVYLVSRLVIDTENLDEKRWLDSLKAALPVDAALLDELDDEVA